MHTVILAGGTSSRMGQDKALLPIKDKVFITYIYERFSDISDEVTVISNTNTITLQTGIPTIQDDERFILQGPLAGMYTAMNLTEQDVYLMVACDMPYACPDIATYLASRMVLHTPKQIDAVIPVSNGRIQPLFACYKRSVLHTLEASLLEGNRRVLDFINQLHVVYISKEQLPLELQGKWDKQFNNINTPKAYHKLQGGLS